MRQCAGLRQALALLAQQAFVLKVAQEVFQPDAVLVLQREGFCDIAFPGSVGIFLNVAKHIVARRPKVPLGRWRLGAALLAPAGYASGHLSLLSTPGRLLAVARPVLFRLGRDECQSLVHRH